MIPIRILCLYAYFKSNLHLAHIAHLLTKLIANHIDRPFILDEITAHLFFFVFVVGQPKFGLPIIDPLRITSLRIDQGHGPVNVRLNFTNLDIIGLTGSSVDHLK